MLGQVIPSSSSLESLELEREEPSKITKHDSLSIYEATLVKLREGAQRKLISVEEQETKIDTDLDSAGNQPCGKVMMIDTHLSPCTVLSSPSELKEQRNKPTTVISMFDRRESRDELPKYVTWSGGVEKLYFADGIRNMWRGVAQMDHWWGISGLGSDVWKRSIWLSTKLARTTKFLDHMMKFLVENHSDKFVNFNMKLYFPG